MTAPIVLAFDVQCPQDRAFDLWTARIDTWWPADHTATGRGDVTVVLEAGVGGRIFERTPEGDEHPWGEVTVWSPPDLLAYSWHLRADRGDATEVTVRFVPRGTEATRVEIEHHGWDRLGASAQDSRNRNESGWSSLLPYYIGASTEERPP